MTNESTFQWCLLVALGISYAFRTIVRALKGKHLRDAPLHCVLVMLAWTAVLIISGIGFTPHAYHVAVATNLRWAGFGLMLVSVVVSTVDWADLFASRMALNAAIHADYGSHRLELNSAFVSFALCSFGAFLLSADLVVLAASTIALFAMKAWVRHDNPRPA